MKLNKSLLALSFLLLLSFSCGKRKLNVPEGILEQKQLVPLLVELHLVDGQIHISNISPNSRKDSAFYIYPAILQKYNITRAQFDSTILFYGKYPDEFSKIYDDVLEELSRREGEVRILVDSLPVDENI